LTVVIITYKIEVKLSFDGMVTTVYNEEIKKEFIEERVKETRDTRKTFKSLFEVTEAIESKYSEDLHSIPMEVVARELLQTGKIGAFSSLKTYMSRIKSYNQWALERNHIPKEYRALIAEQCDFRKIFNEYSKAVIIKSPEELMRALTENLSLNYKQGYVNYDFLVAGYLILLFSGVRNEDTMDIEISDFGKTRREIVFKYQEKFIKIYSEFFEIVNYILEHRTYRDAKTDPPGLFMGNAFLDNGKSWNKKRLKSVISTITSDKNIFKSRFRPDEVYIMGQIYRNKSSSKKELIKICYGEDYTRAQRERVGRIYDMVYDN